MTLSNLVTFTWLSLHCTVHIVWFPWFWLQSIESLLFGRTAQLSKIKVNQWMMIDVSWELSVLAYHDTFWSRHVHTITPWVSLCTLLDFLDFDSYFLKVYCLVDPKKEVAQLNFQKSKSIDWEFFSPSLSWHFLIASRSHDCHCIALCRLFPWIWLRFFESF